jgi:tetrahydromethanopterin S-methyltransferase subunit A
MIESGDAYMHIENMVAANPQNILRCCPCNARNDTSATVEKMVATIIKRPNIFTLSLGGANIRNIITYIASMAAPVPFIVQTSKLLGETKGKPYLQTRAAFNKTLKHITYQKKSKSNCMQ